LCPELSFDQVATVDSCDVSRWVVLTATPGVSVEETANMPSVDLLDAVSVVACSTEVGLRVVVWSCVPLLALL